MEFRKAEFNNSVFTTMFFLPSKYINSKSYSYNLSTIFINLSIISLLVFMLVYSELWFVYPMNFLSHKLTF